jgi:hypothetical protein
MLEAEFGDGYILVVGSSIPFTTVPTPLLFPLQTVNNSLSNIACIDEFLEYYTISRKVLGYY